MNLTSKFSFPLSLAVCLVANLSLTDSAVAQVTSDNTTGTVVNGDGSNNFTIESGTRNGGNLFHSFQDFSVPLGGEAFFDNGVDVDNILSRVTGGNLSNIEGTIRANGDANLFLINPAGIVFGNDARLDIGGSFYGSTADRILFEDGEFSAVDNLNAPILTVNAPIGLGFRDEPSSITNSSFAINDAGTDTVGLEVASGQTLALIGGDITFASGETTAPGGQIELGGLVEAGTVSIGTDGKLSFPDNVARANIFINNAADLDVRSTGGGGISITGNNLDISGGEFGASLLRAGITADSTSPEAQAGDINFDATGELNLRGGSLVLNFVNPGGTGNAGDINIRTGNLNIIDGSALFSSVSGTGNAGNIDVTATNLILNNGSAISTGTDGVGDSGDITLNVSGNSELISSNISSQVFANGVGEGGEIEIATANLSLFGGSQISGGIFGEGNAGAVTITATDTVTFQGRSGDGLPSGVINNVAPGGRGNAGNVEVTTANLELIDGGSLTSNIFGEGDAGDINVTATNLNLSNGGGISSGTGGVGNAGNIFLNISGDTELTSSIIITQVGAGAVGSGGTITINTNNLALFADSQINAGVFGEGNAGRIAIAAIDTITFQGTDNVGFEPTGVINNVFQGGVGNAGDVEINTANLNLIDGGAITSDVFGEGNAGNVNVNATNNINISGFFDFSNDGQLFVQSEISSSLESGGTGNAGNVTVSANNLNLANAGIISSGTDGAGNAGNVAIAVRGNTQLNNSNITSQVFSNGVGEGGTITIDTNNLSLLEGAQISAGVFGRGNAGMVTANATETITFQGANSNGFSSGIINNVDPRGEGNAGDIEITTANLELLDGGSITSNVFGAGNAGNIAIAATNLNQANGGGISSGTNGIGNAGNIVLNIDGNAVLKGSNITSQVFTDGVGAGGTVTINATNLSLFEGAQISAGVFGRGDAGVVTINARESITFQGASSDGLSSGIINNIAAGGVGNAGDVEVTTNNLDLIDGGSIASNVFGEGNAGNINVTATNLNQANGGNISSSTAGIGNAGNILLNISENAELTSSNIITQITENAVGEGGTISINSGNLSLLTGSQINAGVLGEGNAGNINVTADNLNLREGSFIASGTSGLGDGGNIVLNVSNDTELTGSNISSQIFFDGVGRGGTIALNTGNLSLLEGAQISAGIFGEGNAGSVTIDARETVTFQGISSDSFASGIVNNVDSNGIGNAGNINLTATELNLIDGGTISSSINGLGNGGNINLNVREDINISGFTVFNENTIRTSEITSSVVAGATGEGGNIVVTTRDLALDNGAEISADTEGAGNGGDLTLNIDDRLDLRNNSKISVAAEQANTDGGNITINAPDGFVVAFPNSEDGNGNDISAFSRGGVGGNITIEAQGVLGLRERTVRDGNNTNDIDASGEIDGNVEIITPNADAIEGSTELTTIPIEAGETIAQACSAQRGIANSNLVLMGKGGVPHAPADTLQSEIISVGGKVTTTESPASDTILAVETAKGKIVPARGVEITETGEIILTAYQTEENSRQAREEINCDRHVTQGNQLETLK